jgi:phosphonate transport system permease protein
MTRSRTPLLFAGGFLLLLVGLWRVDASPMRIAEGLGKLGWLLALMWPPSPGGQLSALLGALAETVAMAFLATLLASCLALPLSFLGARNVIANALTRFTARRSYDGLRAVDSLVWALIFVSAVGMGPFAGILALALPDIGTLAKTFSEALESSDRRPVEGVRAAGGSRLEAIRFGLIPQAAPVMLAQVLYTFESNTRSATIIGVVGAGGIGLALADRMRINNWDEAAFIVLLILAAVGAIDWASRWIRMRLIRP